VEEEFPHKDVDVILKIMVRENLIEISKKGGIIVIAK
jgi:hypothetical protein